jgi:hypothetical protein
MGPLLLLSCRSLTGRYTALSADFSRFLTVQDVLSNAIWIAPIAFLGTAYRVWGALLSGKTPAEGLSNQICLGLAVATGLRAARGNNLLDASASLHSSTRCSAYGRLQGRQLDSKVQGVSWSW